MVKEDLFQKYAECNIEVPPRTKDLRGRRFGLFVAEKYLGLKGKNVNWLCRCDCGGASVVQSSKLLLGSSTHCGNRFAHADEYNRDLVVARFLSFVDKRTADECWRYTQSLGTNGYGRFKFMGRRFLAHRLAYELENGPFEKSLDVLHSCDNPPCCNPSHLRLGTHQENIKERTEKLRTSRKLSPDDVREIRAAIASGEGDTQISRRYAVTSGAILAIRIGRTWGWMR